MSSGRGLGGPLPLVGSRSPAPGAQPSRSAFRPFGYRSLPCGARCTLGVQKYRLCVWPVPLTRPPAIKERSLLQVAEFSNNHADNLGDPPAAMFVKRKLSRVFFTPYAPAVRTPPAHVLINPLVEHAKTTTKAANGASTAV
jgi:hypothetical protein